MPTSAAEQQPVSKRDLWIARILKALVVLFLLLDATVHIVQPAPVVTAMHELGYPLDVTRTIGVIQLACTALYVIPATSTFGAILLTGYIGGAVSAHMRIGHPAFESYIFPVIVGAMVWGGIFPWVKSWIFQPVASR